MCVNSFSPLVFSHYTEVETDAGRLNGYRARIEAIAVRCQSPPSKPKHPWTQWHHHFLTQMPCGLQNSLIWIRATSGAQREPKPACLKHQLLFAITWETLLSHTEVHLISAKEHRENTKEPSSYGYKNSTTLHTFSGSLRIIPEYWEQVKSSCKLSWKKFLVIGFSVFKELTKAENVFPWLTKGNNLPPKKQRCYPKWHHCASDSETPKA